MYGEDGLNGPDRSFHSINVVVKTCILSLLFYVVVLYQVMLETNTMKKKSIQHHCRCSFDAAVVVVVVDGDASDGVDDAEDFDCSHS